MRLFKYQCDIKMQIKKLQFCVALAASTLQSVVGDLNPDQGVVLDIGPGADSGHGHGHLHHPNKVSIDLIDNYTLIHFYQKNSVD